MSIKNQNGFSLVELMTVIAIIGMLASMGIPSYQNFLTKSKYTRARSEMTSMATMLYMLRIEQNMTTLQLTGYGCTACIQGWGSVTSKQLNVTDPQVLKTFSLMGFSSVPKDPWGGYYMIDENEGEFAGNDCRGDVLLSAGPDYNSIFAVPVTGDEATLVLETLNPNCGAVNYSGFYKPGWYGW